MNECLPIKTFKVNNNDKPFMNRELKRIDRKRKREYLKRKKSQKWVELDELFSQKVSTAKENYYQNIVKDLKKSAPGQWYSKIKRMACNDPTKTEKVLVQEISDKTSEEQVELIADVFAEISNEYEKLKSSDIDLNDCWNYKFFPAIFRF